jgi:putative FmdB family regulatory protein
VPTYQYSCTDCGEQVEAVQKFTDEPLKTCPACGGRLRKVFSPVGVVFKGSGFYRTDSRATSKPTAGKDSSKEGGAKETAPGSRDGAKVPAGAGSSGSGGSGSGSSGSSGSAAKPGTSTA